MPQYSAGGKVLNREDSFNSHAHRRLWSAAPYLFVHVVSKSNLHATAETILGMPLTNKGKVFVNHV